MDSIVVLVKQKGLKILCLVSVTLQLCVINLATILTTIQAVIMTWVSAVLHVMSWEVSFEQF